MNGWPKARKLVLVGLIAGNIIGFACYFVLQKTVATGSPKSTLTAGDTLVRFAGVDMKGAPWASKDAACHLIRITDDGCEFCRKDKTSYEAVLLEARRSSCEVIEVAPRAGGMALDERPGVIQLKLLDADIGAQLFPFVTPQTILVDEDWKVQMMRRGAFDAKSLSRMKAQLRSIAASRVLK